MINRGDSIDNETRTAYESIASHDLLVAFISIVRGNIRGHRGSPRFPPAISQSIYLFIYVLPKYNGQ